MIPHELDETFERGSLHRMVRRFRWSCPDCRHSGVMELTFPIRPRDLEAEAEAVHRKSHPWTMCPGDYFEISPDRAGGESPNDKLTDAGGDR